MKKFLPLILILAALVSCGDKKNQDSENIPEAENSAVTTENTEKSAETQVPKTTAKSGKNTNTSKNSVTTAKSGSKKTTKANENSGNTKTEKNNPESESKAAEPIEFREYYPEDFTDITVQLTRQEGEPPVEFSEIDYSWFDTEEKLSACKSNMEIVEAKIAEEEQRYLEWADENFEEYFESYRTQVYDSLETPHKGRIIDYTYGDGNAYFLINYDDLCGDYLASHCMEIVKCDLEAQTTEVIFSHDSLDNPIDMQQIVFNSGDIWASIYSDSGDNFLKTSLVKINTKKNSFEQNIGIPEEIDYAYPIENDDGRLLIEGYKYNDDYSDCFIYEYDRKAKDFKEIYSYSGDNFRYSPVYGQGCVVIQENIDNCASAVCEKFRLNTGIKGAELEAVSDNRVTFISDTLTGTTLYTYDLQKMERYEINIDNFGDSAAAVGDNLILSGSMGHTYTFLIPDIGAAFVMLSLECAAESKNSDGSLYIVGNPYNDEKYNFVGEFVGHYDEEKKIYIFSE